MVVAAALLLSIGGLCGPNLLILLRNLLHVAVLLMEQPVC